MACGNRAVRQRPRPAIRSTALLVWSGALLSWAVGCKPAGDGSSAPPSIVLFTLDTTRADFLGCYGRAQAHTPVLDALARDSLLFEQAYSVCPLTLPSHASIFTGLYPFRHGVRENGSFALAEELPTLAERLADSGYETVAMVASIVLARHHGLAQGFEEYHEPVRKKDSGGIYTSIAAPEVNEAFFTWWRAREGARPFFAWLHYYDPHLPCDPPARFQRKGSTPYDAEISVVDHAVGEILAALAPLQEAGRLITVVVADHGEGLGFRGEETHGVFVYQPTLQVPLLLRLPDGRGAGQRTDSTASLVDLMPTLESLVGLRPTEGLDGVSLLDPSLDRERLVYFESYYPYLQHGWSPLSGMVGAGYKYIHSTRPELYELSRGEDPEAERLDEAPEAARRLRTALQTLTAGTKTRTGAPTDATAELHEQLEELGYLSVRHDLPLPDPAHPPAGHRSPAESVDLLRLFYAATLLGPEGAPAKGAALLGELLARDPDNVAALNYQARFLVQAGAFAAARAPLDRLLKLRPQHAAGWTNLGAVYHADDQLDAAVACFERALSIDPTLPAALQNLAACYRQRGDARAAAEMQARYDALR